MNDENKCPIWGTLAECTYGEGPVVLVTSPRAGGKYSSAMRGSDLGGLDYKIKVKLTSWLVEQRRLGTESPLIDDTVINNIKNHRTLTLQERADKVLIFLVNSTKKLGETSYCTIKIIIQPENSWEEHSQFQNLLAYSECYDWDEVNYLLKYLEERSFVKDFQCKSGSIPIDGFAAQREYFRYMVSMAGYARIAELQSAKTDSSQAFVAMWFDDSMKQIYDESIKPAIDDAGYVPIRIDRKDHNNKIDDEIIA